MNSKHTPGPWAISRDAVPEGHVQNTIYAEASGRRVATAFLTEENANLIAAAPDLLAVAEHFREWLADHFEDFSNDVNMQLLCIDNEASAAIAQARGK